MARDIERERRAFALASLLDCPGWATFKSHCEEEISDSLESLQTLMMASPERLTEKVAFKHGVGARKLKDVLEWVDEEIKYLSSVKQ